MKQLDSRDLRISFAILFLFFGLLSCNAGERNTNSQIMTPSLNSVSVDDTSYPSIITEMGLQKEYDDAKWNLYLYSVIDTPKIANGNSPNSYMKSYGAYPLLFDKIEQNNNNRVYKFSFIMNNDTITNERAFELGIENVPDAVFDGKINDKPARCIHMRGVYSVESICYDYDENILEKIPKELSTEQLEYLRKGSSRLIFPMNPAIISYINKNQANLNVWFIKEAKKRGVIK